MLNFCFVFFRTTGMIYFCFSCNLTHLVGKWTRNSFSILIVISCRCIFFFTIENNITIMFCTFCCRLCLECVYRHRVRLGAQWDSLPRQFSDWLNRKEDLDIQLLMSPDTGSESHSDSDGEGTTRSVQTCVIS